MLPLKEPRCIGKQAGASGHQHPPECYDCERRRAPRFHDSRYTEPPAEVPCPKRIPVKEAK